MSYHWPKGVVSYLFDDQSYDDGVKDRVQIAMAALERDSCIRFKEQKGDGEGSWLHFTNPGMQRNCSHDPSFQKNGEIQVTLGYDCLRQRDIMHSLLHGVGFRDEISHPQRDLFVKIMWGNIQSAYKSMFRIQPVNNAGGLVEYDPMSIMHFHDRAYSLNGQATITPLLPGLRIAPSDKLSHLDKMKLGIMFGHECNKRKVGEVLNRCKGILTQFDEAELTTTKPVDDNTPNNEDVNDDGGNHEENTNASGNNGDQKDSGHEPQDLIVVGNDVNSNHEGDPIASDNNNGDQKGNGDGSQEMIIVGNEEANGNINDEDDVDNNQTDNPENVDPVEDKENSNTIEKIDITPNEEVIIVGNREDSPVNSENAEKGNNDNNGSKDAKETDELIIVGNQNKGGDVSDDNNQDTKGENEIIVVGNEHKGGNEEVIIVGNGENKTGPKDLKERIMKKRN